MKSVAKYALVVPAILALVSCSDDPAGPGETSVELSGMLKVVDECLIPEGCGPKYTLWNEDFSEAVALLGPLRDQDSQLIVSVRGNWEAPPSAMQRDCPGIKRVLRVVSYKRNSRIPYHTFLVPAAREMTMQVYGCEVRWNKTFGWGPRAEGEAPSIWVRMTDTLAGQDPLPYVEFTFDGVSGELLRSSNNLAGSSPCDSR